MKNMHIAFSPPDITEEEIAEVVDTLRSGWITTGPKTKLFEKKLSEYMETNRVVCDRCLYGHLTITSLM